MTDSTSNSAMPHPPLRRPPLILASRSPRRRELLLEAGYSFDLLLPSSEAEAAQRAGESPAEYVARLALDKALDVGGRVAAGTVLACDTVAECAGQILGKPADAAAARQMLELLSSREHRVLTGVCLWQRPDGAPHTRVAETTLRMDSLSRELLDEYIASGGWEGKAGGFGYQDRLGWVHIIAGSESNVVGLPLELLAEMLATL